MSSTIPYFHSSLIQDLPKAFYGQKGIPCVLSGLAVWNFVGRMPVSQSPDWEHPLNSHSEESSCQTVTASIHWPSPSVICTLLSFLPLFSCVAYLLLDVLSSFCMQIWSRLPIRNQYFKMMFSPCDYYHCKIKIFCRSRKLWEYSVYELTGNHNQIVKQLLLLWQSENVRLHVSACEDKDCAVNSTLKAW